MSASHALPLGIDIGGTGIKGAPVDLKKGEFATDRLRIPTPEVSTPEAVGDIVEQIVDHFADLIGDEAVGITIPGVVDHGVVRTAANIDHGWIDHPVEDVLEKRLGRDITVLNDADAAGIGEWSYGAAKKWDEGVVVLATLGTGIGTAVLHNGVLVPNFELGHLEIDGKDAETEASSKVRTDRGWSYEEWAPKLQKYFSTLENLLWPDLIIVGGGVSKDSDKFLPLLDLRTKIVPAKLRNAAGIVGAAREAHDRAEAKGKSSKKHKKHKK
ncbi:polyphosphate--glucose phosphotransferase [Dermacoccaceae bacterium W4C1]